MQPITTVEVSKFVMDSMAEYAVEAFRAIPDVRDGLKPVQRRVLWQTHLSHLTPAARHMKLAKLAGLTLAFHPHGAGSCSGAAVGLSEQWLHQFPLIDIHGNNGAIDGSPAAADRYIEARQSQWAYDLLLSPLANEPVQLVDNFDGTAKEPLTLPSRLPMALINHCDGMAVGLATAMLPHDPIELIDASIALLNKPDLSVEELAKIVQGPSFPTGGTLVLDHTQHIAELTHGRASYTLSGTIEIDEKAKQLIVTELPWGVTTTTAVKSICDVLQSFTTFVTSVRDETTDWKDIHICIECRKSTPVETLEKLKALLLSKSVLSTKVHCTNNVICDSKPMQLGLSQILKAWLRFRTDWQKNVLQYEHTQLEDKLNIVNAKLTVAHMIDLVVAIAKKAESLQELETELQQQLFLPIAQAKYVASLTVWKLAQLGRQIDSLTAEKDKIQQRLEEIDAILNDSTRLNQLIIDDLQAIRKQLIDMHHARKTRITTSLMNTAQIDLDPADAIEDKQQGVVFSKESMWRLGVKALSNQLNGEVPASILATQVGSTKDIAVLVYNDGSVVGRRVNDLDQAALTANMTPLSKQFKTINPAATAMTGAVVTDSQKLVICTKLGRVKCVNAKTLLDACSNCKPHRPAVKQSSLKAGDEIAWAKFIDSSATGQLAAHVVQKSGKVKDKLIDLDWLLAFDDSLGHSGRACINTKNGENSFTISYIND